MNYCEFENDDFFKHQDQLDKLVKERAN
jgi:hypothetical protein